MGRHAPARQQAQQGITPLHSRGPRGQADPDRECFRPCTERSCVWQRRPCAMPSADAARPRGAQCQDRVFADCRTEHPRGDTSLVPGKEATERASFISAKPVAYPPVADRPSIARLIERRFRPGPNAVSHSARHEREATIPGRQRCPGERQQHDIHIDHQKDSQLAHAFHCPPRACSPRRQIAGGYRCRGRCDRRIRRAPLCREGTGCGLCALATPCA